MRRAGRLASYIFLLRRLRDEAGSRSGCQQREDGLSLPCRRDDPGAMLVLIGEAPFTTPSRPHHITATSRVGHHVAQPACCIPTSTRRSAVQDPPDAPVLTPDRNSPAGTLGQAPCPQPIPAGLRQADARNHGSAIAPLSKHKSVNKADLVPHRSLHATA